MENNRLNTNSRRRLGLIVCLFVVALSACSFNSAKLWVANSLANNGEYQQRLNIPYGQFPEQTLDVFFPLDQQQVNDLPVVVFFYGGCWGACTEYKKQHYRFVAQALVEKAVVVIADYRRYPQVLFSDLMTDATAVVEWLKINGAQFGANTNDVFLMGHSSGAHMAAMLTLNEQYLAANYPSVKGFIGMAGPYDFLPFNEAYQKELFGPEKNYLASQPIHFVNGKEAPMLLLYGEKDITVKAKNMVNLAARVKQAGGVIETKTYKDLGHVSIVAALSIPLRGKATVRDDILDFINRRSTKY